MLETLERTEARAGNRSQVAPWQYLQVSWEASGETRFRRNLRRRAEAARRAWVDVYAEDRRDASGLLVPPRAHWCGQSGYGAGSVDVVADGHGGGKVSHLRYCNHVLTCPVCSEIIRRKRAEEIMDGLGRHLHGGGCVLFMTMTVSHGRGDSLEQLMDVMADAMRRLKGRSAWRRFKRESGYIGYIVSLEATYGQNGWHPHRHFAIVLDRSATPGEVAAWADELKESWVDSVAASGGRATYGRGLDLQLANTPGAVANYIAKEIVNEYDTKEGRDSIVPFQLLDGRTPESVRLWKEWVGAARGKNAIRWTPGLKSRLGVGEMSDADITAEHDRAAAGERVAASIDSPLYDKMYNNGATIEQVRLAVLAGDYDHAAAILGCGWYWVVVDGESRPMFARFTGHLDRRRE